MSEAFNIYNLIFLALAIFVFLRLRNVLGRRTGNERKPHDPYSAPGAGDKNFSRDEKVVTLSGKPNVEPSHEDEKDQQPDWSKIAPEGSALAKGLQDIYGLDSSFDPHEFLEGAKIAYEMIVMAFADSDKSTLKNLLSTEVYESFGSVLDAREDRGESVESNFVGIEKADILEAVAKSKQTNITVKFISELISVTRDADGKEIEGDAKKTREVVDIWTFMRDISSRDPNWKLVATEAAN